MAGTKINGRPGGSPESKKYGFKTDHPLKEKLQAQITASVSTR